MASYNFNFSKVFKRVVLLIIVFWALVTNVFSNEKISHSVVSEPRLSVRKWGISAIDLGANPVTMDEFFRMGGEMAPVTPTSLTISQEQDTLHLFFRCDEQNMNYPAVDHKVDWHTNLVESPSEQNGAFPDKIDVFIRPDMSSNKSFQFMVTKDGQLFGSKYDPNANQDNRNEALHGFTANITETLDAWLVYLKIPWTILGGKPTDRFGLAPMRTRWRNSEISSPMTMDFTDRPNPDNYIEVTFKEKSEIYYPDVTLDRLPSGKLHCQRPVSLQYPTPFELEQIWNLQKNSRLRTTTANLHDRIRLLQLWFDLLTLEGFSFSVTSGSILTERISPSMIRDQLNRAFENNNLLQAIEILDRSLSQLDNVTRKWFADGSVGNIQHESWSKLEEVTSFVAEDKQLILNCKSGNREIVLTLELPESGGIRLHGENEGYFKPTSRLDIKGTESFDKYELTVRNGTLLIYRNPFEIRFLNTEGETIDFMDKNGIALLFDDEDQIIAVDFLGRLREDENIYGFGERYDQFNQHGNVLTLWGVDDWIGLTAGLRNQSYKPIPVFHSSKGYTVFNNSSYRLRVDVGKTETDELRLTQHGDIFDYYFWFDTPREAVGSYTQLTGKPFLPPKWAFEPWMGGTSKRWRSGIKGEAVAEQKYVVERMLKLDIPHSALYLEGTSDRAEIHNFLKPTGIRPLSWQWSSINISEAKKLFPEKEENKLPLLKDIDGNIINSIHYIDFSHPDALELSRQRWKRRLDFGSKGSMVDFGDRVPETAVFYDGKKGDEMHNFYAYDYHRTYYEVFKERLNNDFILYGRAAAPGSQQWTASFAGDIRSNFIGLQSALNGALNLGACGFAVWGSDLGGFKGWPDPLVYIRWTQFSCFSPLMRAHGTQAREPWEYGDLALENYKKFAWIRENLLDYIYNEAETSHLTGVPMMRPLAMEYAKEKRLTSVSDQYMFGSNLLVAPIMSESNQRTIEFPSGNWSCLWTGSTIKGDTSVVRSVALNEIPVYVKDGTIMPVTLNEDLLFGESMTNSSIHALLITLPNNDTTITREFSNGLHVAMQLKEHILEINLDKWHDSGHLILQGTKASGIQIGTVVLPNLKEMVNKQSSIVWYIDDHINRTIVKLPYTGIHHMKVYTDEP